MVEIRSREWHGEARTLVDVPEGVWKRFIQFVREKRVDDWPPLHNSGVMDGTHYHYYHLTREGGRRIAISNPDAGEGVGTVYAQLVELFLALARSKP